MILAPAHQSHVHVYKARDLKGRKRTVVWEGEREVHCLSTPVMAEGSDDVWVAVCVSDPDGYTEYEWLRVVDPTQSVRGAVHYVRVIPFPPL